MIHGQSCKHAILFGLLLLPWPAFPHPSSDEQIARLTARIESARDDPTLYVQRGDQYRYEGDWRHARTDYRRARRIDPTLDIVDLRRGELYLDQGEPRRAKTSLDLYLARRPSDLDGLRARSRALRQLDMPLAAAEDLRRVIAAFSPPRRPEPDDYLELARAFEAAGGAHLDEAILALDEGIAALGPIVSLQFPAIDLDLRAGRIDDALLRVDALEAVSGRKEVWLAKRAEILDRAERKAEARELYAKEEP